MKNDVLNSISVEKFAAYLDGNLSSDEMQQVSSLMETNEMMHDIYAVSGLVDETLANYTGDDLTLPEEITSTDFELPSLFHDLQTSDSPEVFEVAASASCADVIDECNTDVDCLLNDDNPTKDFSSFEDSTNLMQDEISSVSPDEEGGILSDPNDF